MKYAVIFMLLYTLLIAGAIIKDEIKKHGIRVCFVSNTSLKCF